MRKHTPAAVVAALAVTVALGATGSAKADADRTFTVNPFDLSAGIINFEYEGAIGPFLSMHMGLDFLTFDGFSESDGDIFAVGPEMGLRLFPFASAPAGIWAGPFAGVTYLRGESQRGEDVHGIGGYAGGMIGFTLIPFDILVLSAGIGLAYHELGLEADGEEIGLIGLYPRFRLALGVAF